MKKFKDIVENERSPAIISVGDTVSKNLVKNRLFPCLAIVDNRVMRRTTWPFLLKQEKTIRIKNPPGTITEEAVSTIREASRKNNRVKIIVEGEEDLLTLIAVLYAPENSFVVYGQPHEGVVAVKVTPTKRAEVAAILKDMENVRKTK
jgi:hypothetical protein